MRDEIQRELAIPDCERKIHIIALYGSLVADHSEIGRDREADLVAVELAIGDLLRSEHPAADCAGDLPAIFLQDERILLIPLRAPVTAAFHVPVACSAPKAAKLSPNTTVKTKISLRIFSNLPVTEFTGSRRVPFLL